MNEDIVDLFIRWLEKLESKIERIEVQLKTIIPPLKIEQEQEQQYIESIKNMQIDKDIQQFTNNKIKQKVIQLLRNGELIQRDIAKYLGITKGYVSRIKESAEKNGLLQYSL